MLTIFKGEDDDTIPSLPPWPIPTRPKFNVKVS